LTVEAVTGEEETVRFEQSQNDLGGRAKRFRIVKGGVCGFDRPQTKTSEEHKDKGNPETFAGVG